jgi:hypothetical protein
MKTDSLEEFVKNNREEFDHLEPSLKVWENISKNHKKGRLISFNPILLRVAAVLTIVVITSVLAVKTNLFTPGNYAKNTSDPEIRELMEAEAFYAQQVHGKLKEIRKCYYTFPELKEEIEMDLTELEEMYKVLQLDLKDNVSNKAVIEAMIDNNRTRMKLVDDVLKQINC